MTTYAPEHHNFYLTLTINDGNKVNEWVGGGECLSWMKETVEIIQKQHIPEGGWEIGGMYKKGKDYRFHN